MKRHTTKIRSRKRLIFWIAFTVISEHVYVNRSSAFVSLRKKPLGRDISLCHNPLLHGASKRMQERCYTVYHMCRMEDDEFMKLNGYQSKCLNSSYIQRFMRSVLSTLVFVMLGLFHFPSDSMMHAVAASPSWSSYESSPVTTMSGRQRYWDTLGSGDKEMVRKANEKLIDHAVGTINNLYYDHTGGNDFTREDFYDRWKVMKKIAYGKQVQDKSMQAIKPSFDTRDDAIRSLRWLVGTLNDPYSKYLTREELEEEITRNDEGFLGTGMFVETRSTNKKFDPKNKASSMKNSFAASNPKLTKKYKNFLPIVDAKNLPLITAVAPHSPAERSGLIVGDKIVSVGDVSFLKYSEKDISFIFSKLTDSGKSSSPEYFGYTPDLVVASPIRDDSVIIGYRTSKLKLPTSSLKPYEPYSPPPIIQTVELENGEKIQSNLPIAGGDKICNWQLLYPRQSILFRDEIENGSTSMSSGTSEEAQVKVGYIRMTRFSRKSTAAFIEAVSHLESLGAQSYIIDVRNNYGGVVQEAMLTATSVLRDTQAPLCYTINSRGGFTPHDTEEYIVDTRYPGYLMSSEKKNVVIDEVRSRNPEYFTSSAGWDPPSNYASLHEQEIRRRQIQQPALLRQQAAQQKKLVILMNEGTASSAEVFVSSLRDNNRVVALVGSKTYGKGLIQHTFPMPDGGGLRLTVAEYLTPSLQHVTKVGEAQYQYDNSQSSVYIGGGVFPDVGCDSDSGSIPNNPGTDLCVDKALNVLMSSDDEVYQRKGRGTKKIITAGVVRDDF